MTPLATELDAEPIVWDMFDSRMVLRVPKIRIRRNAATVITEIGMEVEIVRPARNPRYALAAPKTMPSKTPVSPALKVNSAGDSAGEQKGSYFLPSGIGSYACNPSRFFSIYTSQ